MTAISDGRCPDEIILGYQNGIANTFNIESQSYSSIEDLEGDESVTGKPIFSMKYLTIDLNSFFH